MMLTLQQEPLFKKEVTKNILAYLVLFNYVFLIILHFLTMQS